ncbi:PLP-dependent transferase, partial [Aureobasidium melanogenum]
MDATQYDAYVEHMRQTEYPMLKDATYLDHAGTTLYSKSLLEAFTADMLGNLYGNPHSASQASQRSTNQVQDVRLQLLRFFDANPDDFDLVFVANATAGIKLVADALREHESGFWYGYHRDAHTSLVGVRELAKEHHCFAGDEEVEAWIEQGGQDTNTRLGLFAYPAQSNMNGRRLPLTWCSRIRNQGMLTLLDAAALVSTSPLSLADLDTTPDFTVLSLYKIFGFPDLGALIVRKDAAWTLQKRRYFGGGTVDMVVSLKEQWHAVKSAHLHEQFEDGTLPIHSIIALKSAISVHRDLFGTLERISEHTSLLAGRLYSSLKSLRHGNDEPVCQIYKDTASTYGDRSTQGPVVAFNLCDAKGQMVSNLEVEKLAHVRNISIRTGGLCNPGGIQSALNLPPWQMKKNFSSGQRCGSENDDVINGQPTGMIRASLGAMSTTKDVE